jgi:hypothetical protein
MIAHIVTAEILPNFNSVVPETITEVVDKLILSNVATLGELIYSVEAGKRD